MGQRAVDRADVPAGIGTLAVTAGGMAAVGIASDEMAPGATARFGDVGAGTCAGVPRGARSKAAVTALKLTAVAITVIRTRGFRLYERNRTPIPAMYCSAGCTIRRPTTAPRVGVIANGASEFGAAWDAFLSVFSVPVQP